MSVCVCVNIHLLGVEAVLAQVGEEFSDRAFQKGVSLLRRAEIKQALRADL